MDNLKHNICRTCLKKENLIDLFKDCNEEICLVDKLMYCTFIDIKLNDGLPSQICLECVKSINMCFEFAKKCELTEIYLQKNKQTNEPSTENTTISTETTTISTESTTKTVESTTTSENTSEIILQEHCYVLDTKPKKKNKLGPPYKCTKCSDEFAMFHLLKEHYKLHKTKEFSFTNCKYCDKKVSFRNLKKHESLHLNEKKYCCEFCGKNFNHESNFQRHRRIHTGEKPYKCDICEKRFIQKSSLTDHRRIHTGERPFICNYCGKRYSTMGYLNLHVKQHTKSKNSEKSDTKDDNDGVSKSTEETICCQQCPLQFTTHRALKTHLVTHSEKNFKCEICFRTFIDSTKLNSHLKIHTGPRNYSCIICGKKFLTKHYLKRHCLIHLEGKPFNCDICDKKFNQMGHLKYHKRIHSNEKPHVCPYCNKSFRMNGTLTVHIRTHTKSTPHVCKICDKGFCDTNGLKLHMKNHHK